MKNLATLKVMMIIFGLSFSVVLPMQLELKAQYDKERACYEEIARASSLFSVLVESEGTALSKGCYYVSQAAYDIYQAGGPTYFYNNRGVVKSITTKKIAELNLRFDIQISIDEENCTITIKKLIAQNHWSTEIYPLCPKLGERAHSEEPSAVAMPGSVEQQSRSSQGLLRAQSEEILFPEPVVDCECRDYYVMNGVVGKDYPHQFLSYQIEKSGVEKKYTECLCKMPHKMSIDDGCSKSRGPVKIYKDVYKVSLDGERFYHWTNRYEQPICTRYEVITERQYEIFDRAVPFDEDDFFAS